MTEISNTDNTDAYDDVLTKLRTAYDAKVAERERHEAEPWKRDERERFLELLRAERKTTLVDIGAGTGRHAKFFADAGLRVACIDLSPAMVDACRAKGLTAYQQDFLSIDLPEAFDAAFAMNSLLHVPETTLPDVFAAVRDALAPRALFYVGQYGGIDRAGPLATDPYQPKRFFSLLSDERLRAIASTAFDVHELRRVDVPGPGTHFQAMVLRRTGPDLTRPG